MMKGISIYRFGDRYIIVPKQKYIAGLTCSKNRFIVSEGAIGNKALWKLIEQGFNEFEIVSDQYDRNSPLFKSFNKMLSRSVGMPSYKKFWENSQFMELAIRDDNLIIGAMNRATDFKGYQGYFIPPEEYSLQDYNGEFLTNRIQEIFRLMYENESRNSN